MRVCALIVLLFAASLAPAHARLPLELIQLPEGFQIDVYADHVPGARSMTRSASGVLYVGTRDEGKVYALLDTDGDQRTDKKHVIAEGLNMPNGVVFHQGSLYVAEIHRILRFTRIEDDLSRPPEPQVIWDRLPSVTSHGWKYLALGPDGWLYFGIGAPCNVCPRQDPFSSIYRIKLDGSVGEIYARGVRNTVGFDWHPLTKELWFTENGRDLMGDNLPPDELNHAPTPNLDFGFPYCHGGTIVDPEYGTAAGCRGFNPPAVALGPHVAALGMKFYTGRMFPDQYRGQIFIAQHGSWNRSKKIGYRLMSVKLLPRGQTQYRVFARGWLQSGEKVWGRPVDVLVMPDGALLVSDDHAGAIYRISYR